MIRRPAPRRRPVWATVVVGTWWAWCGASTAQAQAVAPPSILAVDLATAPTASVALPVADQIALGVPVCGVQGAPWASASADGDGIQVDRAGFAPAWLRIELGRRESGRRSCAMPTTLRAWIGPGGWLPASESAATVLPESGMVEVRATSVDAYDLVAHRRGTVLARGECMGGRTCALQLDETLIGAWLRAASDVELQLWPHDVPADVGQSLPALHDGTAFLARETWNVASIRYALVHPLLQTRTIDGTAERTLFPVTVPMAVADVSCKFARCAMTPQGLEVYAVDPTSLRVQVRLELRPDVQRVVAGKLARSETFSLEVQRCAIRLPSDAPLLAGVSNHAYVLAVSKECVSGDLRELQIGTQPPTTAWVRGELQSRDRGYRAFEIVFAEVPERVGHLELLLRRADAVGTTLAAARVPIASDFQPVGIRLEANELGALDFIPRNRAAKLEIVFASPRWAKEITVVARPGFYTIGDDGKSIRGAATGTGAVPLRLAYAPAALRELLGRRAPVAIFETAARFSVRTMNVPLPLTRPAAEGKGAIVRVACPGRGDTGVHEIRDVTPGRTVSIAYEDRFGCRLVLDRSAIPEEAGEQRLRVKAPGVDEVITLSGRPGTLEIAIPVGSREEFDAIDIVVAHEYTGAHYDFSPRQRLGADAAWHLILGDRSFRASVGTAMPTGLFRFDSAGGKGAVAFSAGGLARVSWLYKEGREFPIGLDVGVLGTSLSSDPQLSLVAGLGFSVPVLNANTSLQASFNLHAWVEFSPTRNSGPIAFLFGPSFAVGRFSTNL